MLHAACTQGNRANSRLLVVGSQIVTLTFDLSFEHNLCFRCPNGRCEPILNIHASIAFQWYKELFKAMGFGPYNRALKIRESIWDSNSQQRSSLGNVRVHNLTFFGIPESMWCDSRVFLLAHNLVTPCLGRKLKARVATCTPFIYTCCGTYLWKLPKQAHLGWYH